MAYRCHLHSNYIVLIILSQDSTSANYKSLHLDMIPLTASNIWVTSWESRLFAYAKTKMQISFAVTAQLISTFVFATRIVQFLFFFNPKRKTSSLFLWFHRPFCVRLGWKPWRPIFSRHGSYELWQSLKLRRLNTEPEIFEVLQQELHLEKTCNLVGWLISFFTSHSTAMVIWRWDLGFKHYSKTPEDVNCIHYKNLPMQYTENFQK